MYKSKTKKIVLAAMFAALCCVATMIIKIPSPLKGYINLGDCVVLMSAFTLTPLYAFFAAGVGSALADIFLGYVVYAPATFVIKGIMAIIACYLTRILNKKANITLSRITGGIAAEVFMVLGYFVFEGFMYGFLASVINIPANAVQGVAGIIIGVVLQKSLQKILKNY